MVLQGDPWQISIPHTVALLRTRALSWDPSRKALLRVVIAGALRDEYRDSQDPHAEKRSFACT